MSNSVFLYIFFYRAKYFEQVCAYCIINIIYIVSINATTSTNHFKYMQNNPTGYCFTSKLSRTSLI